MECTIADSELEKYSDAMLSLAEYLQAEAEALPRWRFIKRRRLMNGCLNATAELLWTEQLRARRKQNAQ